MIDGFAYSLKKKKILRLVKAVVDACHPSGVTVETELGKVGGVEDDLDGGDNIIY